MPCRVNDPRAMPRRALPSMDSNGLSDPYVMVTLLPDPLLKNMVRCDVAFAAAPEQADADTARCSFFSLRTHQYKTKVIPKTLNPNFDETFHYEVHMAELAKRRYVNETEWG